MNRDIFRLDEISIRGLCTDLIRYIWMIILAAVSVWLAATAIHNLTYEPEYTASSTLVVDRQTRMLLFLLQVRWRMCSARYSRVTP